MSYVTDRPSPSTTIAPKTIGGLRAYTTPATRPLTPLLEPLVVAGHVLYATPEKPKLEREAEQALSKLYALVEANKPRGAMDYLLATVDDAFHEGRFEFVDALLYCVQLDRLNLSLELALLGFTQPAKTKLSHRADLVSIIEKRVRDAAPDRHERLLARVR